MQLSVRNLSFAVIVGCLSAPMLFMASSALAKDRVYGVEISPSGGRYVILRDVGDQRAFAIYDSNDAAAKPMAIGIGAVDVEDFEWGGDDYLVYKVKGEKGGIDTTEGLKTLTVSRWMSISRLTGELKTLFGNERGSDYYYFISSAGKLLSTLPGENGQALFARSSITVTEKGPSRLQESDDIVEYSIQRANLKNGDTRQTVSGNKETIDWVVDSSGAVIARIDQKKMSGDIEIFAAKGGGKQLTKVGEIPGAQARAEEIMFLGAGSTPRSIQAAIKNEAGLRLTDFNLDTGSFSSAPIAPPSGEITEIPYDARTARARLFYYSAARMRAYHLDDGDRAAQASLEKALPGSAVAIVSKSIDGSRMIVHAGYVDRGDEYYFFDRGAKRLELIASN